LISIVYGILLRKLYVFFWRRYPDPFSTVFYALFITSFQFTTDSIVPFEQHTFLLILCYMATSIFVRKYPYPASPVVGRLAPHPQAPTPSRLHPQSYRSADSDSAG
jgi:hypothetical protein